MIYPPQIRKDRWQETFEAIESVAAGKVVDANDVHIWLNTWGTENELNPPKADE